MCRAKVAWLSVANALEVSADVVLRGFEGLLAFIFQPMVVGGQSCAAMASSRGGSLV